MYLGSILLYLYQHSLCCSITAEKALAKFIPSTSQDEEIMGYNKFELAAVLIQDGFQVYEILKGTRDIIVQLQATILKEIRLSRDNMSIIEFYLRQIQSFCDVREIWHLDFISLRKHSSRLFSFHYLGHGRSRVVWSHAASNGYLCHHATRHQECGDQPHHATENSNAPQTEISQEEKGTRRGRTQKETNECASHL